LEESVLLVRMMEMMEQSIFVFCCCNALPVYYVLKNAPL